MFDWYVVDIVDGVLICLGCIKVCVVCDFIVKVEVIGL